MVRAVHDEPDAAGDRAELADDQLVADEREVVENVALEILRIVRIIIVGVIANDDVRVVDGVLDETDLREAFHRMLVVRIGAVQSNLRNGGRADSLVYVRPPLHRKSRSPQRRTEDFLISMSWTRTYHL